jgi:hypothetical protein
MATPMVMEASASASRQVVSINRLVCLSRHWTWADEARARFERERAGGWESDDDPLANHLFGAYYHWGALLCCLSDAVVEHGLLARPTLAAIGPDLEACLPVLRACRERLMVVPASRESQPRIVDLLRDGDMIHRLRRVHGALGDALRDEQAGWERELLETHER